jgi:2-polyprenyl-6-methoxyphenol hydroxylase-like FAD-dependent oxidoreductase
VGIDAAVFERAPELHEVGAGVSLWSNAVTALARLGVRDAVVAAGAPLERTVTMTADGTVLSDVSLCAMARELGQPSICVHRADLQRTLASAVDPARIHLGATCVGVEQDGDGVAARFADGRVERGSILIGADGIRSVVREGLWGRGCPRYAGYVAFRGIARGEYPGLPAGTALLGLGRGAQLGIVRCAAGRVYWFAGVNAPEGTDAADGSRKERARATFSGWFPLVATAIEATPEDALLVNDIVDRPPSRRWGVGRITLLGDAAHPTTPNLGQGACQALEDAVVLATALRDAGVGADALRRYEATRRRRTAMITRQSWWLGKMLQLESPLAIRARNALLRTGIGQRQTTANLRAVLSHALPA